MPTRKRSSKLTNHNHAVRLASALGVVNDFALVIEGNAVRKGFRKLKPKLNRATIATFIANEHGELSERWEAFRAGNLMKPCDKAEKMKELGLPALTCAEEEHADSIIRALDSAKAHGIDIAKALAVKHVYNTTRPRKHGGKKA